MPIVILAAIVVGVIAVRYPIVNTLMGWLVVFPIVTLSGGTIAWSIVIQRWDSLYSWGGYGAVLSLTAILVAVGVARMNRT